MRFFTPIIGLLLASLAGAQTAPPQDADWEGDVAVLKGMGLPTKGPALLKILKERTPSAQTIKQFTLHVSRLDAATFAERSKAQAELLKMGPVVRPLLLHRLDEPTLALEPRRRLETVLENFPAEKESAVVTAAAHLLERDKPAGRLSVLLAFAPHASNELVRQEVQRALNGAALESGKPAAALLAALKDENPAHRAAAAEAVVHAVGSSKVKEQIAPLLQDADPLVRYQLGLALVETHDKAGLALLIRTIAEGPPERAETALDLLQRAAGESAPNIYYQGKQNAAAVAGAWRTWHDKHLARLDISTLSRRQHLGYTIIATMQIKPNGKGNLFELGPHGQDTRRWEFDGPRMPIDVQILGPNRLLCAEYTERRVTERDFKGNILKQFDAVSPIACQRLPSGHTFIASRQRLQIVDADGKETFAWTPQPNPFIIAAQCQRNGQMAVLHSGGLCVLLDPQGKELKRFNVAGLSLVIGMNIEMLPNGRVLIPLYAQQQIAEFDWTGKKIWQAPAPRPLSVSRLPNGNTLVTGSMIPYRVIEIDREGREVWSFQTSSRPYRARGR